MVGVKVHVSSRCGLLSADVDECAKSTHNCSAECVNTRGGFQCGCPHGYQLRQDGVSCEGLSDLHLLYIAHSQIMTPSVALQQLQQLQQFLMSNALFICVYVWN